MRNIGNNGNIGFEAAGNHFCATEPNFFLYGINGIKGERQFNAFLMDALDNGCDHKSANAVIESTANEVPFLIEPHGAVCKSYHGSYVNTKCFHFILAGASAIDKKI